MVRDPETPLNSYISYRDFEDPGLPIVPPFLTIVYSRISVRFLQMMSSTGDQTRSLASSVKRLWALGGFPAYYRGLTVCFILSMFPHLFIQFVQIGIIGSRI